MSDKTTPPERTDWKRIGLIATVLLVPGGFLLGGVLAARRLRAAIDPGDDVAPEDSSAAIDPQD